MDENFETANVETSETPETNFGKEITKTFAISTAVSAGVIAGFMVVGLAVNKFQDFKARRNAKLEAELFQESTKD